MNGLIYAIVQERADNFAATFPYTYVYMDRIILINIISSDMRHRIVLGAALGITWNCDTR